MIARYFGMFNKSRRDRWVFGDRKSGAYLLKFAWTRIVRHQLVRSGASPDDPALAEYWAERRRKAPSLPIDRTSLRLLKQQDGRCPLCRDWLLPADDPPQSPREWEQWLATTRKTISRKSSRGTTRRTRPNPVSCTPTATAGTTPREAAARHFCPPVSLQGLLEPDAVKAARPVLRGAERSNALGLPARKARSSSGGRYLPGLVPTGAIRSILTNTPQPTATRARRYTAPPSPTC